ncbi:hypothetical protein HPP92_000639 [Vanilla planifolia]|uniref:ATP synthase subunit d, mitochondrial n=1 Tax=Vanilla planifolia TaxID=51239 RepID=A0A835S1R1_VANPL|nr:hypothetical protein HPP92_000639 [Vanilla planifolia]
MSGSGAKKIVEAAAKAKKTIDWESMAKMLVSDEARKEFSSSARPSMRLTISSIPNSASFMDAYIESISSNDSLVDEKYKKGMRFAGIEIPKFVDTVTTEYKPKFEALLVELKEAEQLSLKQSERLEKEIAEVRELKEKISTMTAEDYFQKHPELKQKFDDEIRNDYWGY